MSKPAARPPPIRFIVPDYCNHYKPLLVDDFAINASPLMLHYGKCAVIGQTVKDPADGRTYLGSMRLVGLSRKYQCPDGTSRVLLHTHAFGRCIPENKTVIVFGEAALFDRATPDDSMENTILITSKELMLVIGKKQVDLEASLGLPPRPPSGLSDCSLHSRVRSALVHELHSIGQRYEPAITVHTFNLIDDPHALISSNLHLARIRKIRDAKQAIHHQRLKN